MLGNLLTMGLGTFLTHIVTILATVIITRLFYLLEAVGPLVGFAA